MYAQQAHSAIFTSVVLYLILMIVLIGTLSLCAFAYYAAGWTGVLVTWVVMSGPVALITGAMLSACSGSND